MSTTFRACSNCVAVGLWICNFFFFSALDPLYPSDEGNVVVYQYIWLQGRSENNHYFVLLNIIFSQIYPEIIPIIRDPSKLSRIMPKPSRIRFFFEKLLLLVKFWPIKIFHVFCWSGLKYENGVFLSYIVTVFLILNHQMASINI